MFYYFGGKMLYVANEKEKTLMKNINFFAKNKTLGITTLALFLALGFVFPQVFHAVGLGSAFSPMHIPVLLCGLVCGGLAGAVCGFLTPYLCAITGMPPLYPTAVAMSLELATYGFVIGVVYSLLSNPEKNKNFFNKTACILALIIAMIVGRLVYGIVMWLLVAIGGGKYAFSTFLSAVVLNSWQAIVLQIILIPLIMFTLQKTGVLNKYNCYDSRPVNADDN